MSQVETLCCDGKHCQEVKRESNKWWVLLEHPSGVFVTTGELMDGLPEVFRRGSFTRHDACSEACLHKILGEWTRRAHLPSVPELEEMLTAPAVEK